MNCYYCGTPLNDTNVCPGCGTGVKAWKRIAQASNFFYNEGLLKAKARDMSGAVESLKISLRYNKHNTDARNLLGLVYYEVGEVVNALSEWVISRSFQPVDNIAGRYLADIQMNSAQLDMFSQTTRKFNQALTYCREENYDLAVIQLKKILSQNPKMVKGHQLLALLYMREARYEAAVKSLHAAEAIDVANPNTKRYLRECKEAMRQGSAPKPAAVDEEETVTYQSGNETIIRPTKVHDHMALRTVVNLLIGAAIGIAVAWFLIIPEIRQQANSDASAQVVEANQNLSTKEQTIQNLESEIRDLEAKVEAADAAAAAADEKSSSYTELLNAYVLYSQEKYTEAGTTLSSVNKDSLDESAQVLYTDIESYVKSAMLSKQYSDAITLADQKDYQGAVNGLLPICTEDPGYRSGEAAYYLGYMYYRLADYPSALKWFQTTLQYSGNEGIIQSSQEFVAELNVRTGQAVPAPSAGDEDSSYEQ